jgi:predicted dehydrogenase
MDLFAGEVEWLSGMAEQRMRPWAVEDFSAAMLKFKNGVTGLICGAELTQYSDHAFELRGTTGLIRMDPEQVCLFQSKVSMSEPDSGFEWSSLEEVKVERPAPASTYVAALAELIDTLKGKGSLRSDGAVGRRSLEMVMAIYQSQLEGNGPVHFPVSLAESGVGALRRDGQFTAREK